MTGVRHYVKREDKKELRSRVCALRDEHGLSFVIIGKRMGLAPSTIADIYRGIRANTNFLEDDVNRNPIIMSAP